MTDSNMKGAGGSRGRTGQKSASASTKPANRLGRRGRNDVSGIAVRTLAVGYIRAVLIEGRVLDDVIAKELQASELPAGSKQKDRRLQAAPGTMEQRDRGMARLIAATVLRRRGQLDAVLIGFLQKPLDIRKGNIWAILQAAAAQLLFLETPAHAAINIAVAQCRGDRGAHRFAGLANAVLRKVATKGPDIVAGQDAVKLNTPPWLWQNWSQAYGEDTARQIAGASNREAALDITLKDGSTPEIAAQWAERLHGTILPTGTIRVVPEGPIEEMAGFDEGAWWVQDTAASLPARLLGDVTGRRILDVCAAPGGKTAQLVAAGAQVTALDSSASRLQRLSANLTRLQLTADVIEADATHWTAKEPYDAMLIDAPCSSTGTMRRHPDIAHLKEASDTERLVGLQRKIVRNMLRALRPGGTLVYCTCSLQREEGEEQIDWLLAGEFKLRRSPITASEISGESRWLTGAGDLRTLPYFLSGSTERLSGMDGFFAARLVYDE